MPHYDYEYAIYDVERSIMLAAGDDISKAQGLVLAPDDGLIAVLLEEGGVDIRTLPSLDVVHRLEGEPTIGLAFLDAGHLVTVQSENALHVWQLDDGSEVMPPLEHPDEIRVPYVDPSGRLIATGCNDGWVRIYQWQVEDLAAEARGRVDHGLDDNEIQRLDVEYLEERARDTAVPEQRSERPRSMAAD
jgi:WD40 repeat protein